MMSITADFVDTPVRLPATQRPRLRLKSAHRSCGHVLVIPPYTEPSEAYATVIAAARADDVSTPDQLLGLRPPRRAEPKHARVALHRWETDGGSLHAVGS